MQAHEVKTTAEIIVATADATETAPVLETTVGNEQPVVTVPYSSLHPSPLNALVPAQRACCKTSSSTR